MNKQISEHQKITRHYEIDYEQFLKFFEIKGKFQSVSLMTTKPKKHGVGYWTTDPQVEPWILITTEEVLGDFQNE